MYTLFKSGNSNPLNRDQCVDQSLSVLLFGSVGLRVVLRGCVWIHMSRRRGRRVKEVRGLVFPVFIEPCDFVWFLPRLWVIVSLLPNFWSWRDVTGVTGYKSQTECSQDPLDGVSFPVTFGDLWWEGVNLFIEIIWRDERRMSLDKRSLLTFCFC